MLNSCYGGELRDDCTLKISEETQIKIQVAKSEQERATGLMYRKEMATDRGMLFVFHDEDLRSFWMKNTFIPLDIIFIDESGVVRNVLKNVPPLTKKARQSVLPAKYVLELNAGQSDRFQINEGLKLDLSWCLVN